MYNIQNCKIKSIVIYAMNKMALSRSVYVGVKKETAEMKKKKKIFGTSKNEGL